MSILYETTARRAQPYAFYRTTRSAWGLSSQEYTTRCVDVVCASLAIVCLAPLVLTLAALIFIQDGGNPFYMHTRLKRGGQIFRLYKLRSMVLDAELCLQAHLLRSPEARQEWEETHKLKQDPRITTLGRFIRRWSLDELPQLLNILQGDMSFVGPRPIAQAETVKYGRWIHHYYAVRPGLTGLWQVSGRNNTTYRRRVALDVVYVQRKNWWLDITIVLRTIGAVLNRCGAY